MDAADTATRITPHRSCLKPRPRRGGFPRTRIGTWVHSAAGPRLPPPPPATCPPPLGTHQPIPRPPRPPPHSRALLPRPGSGELILPPPLPLPLLRSTPCVRGWPSATPDDGPPQARGGGGGGGGCVSPLRRMVSMVQCGSARLLSQPACIAPGLRSGLHWLKGSGDDPVGCG